MLQLVAHGAEASQTFSRALPAGATIRLGRAPRQGWATPWDPYISREHADIRLDGNRLLVRCADGATNPLYFNGQAVRELTAGVGDSFRIGKTTFTLEQIDFQSPPEESIVERTIDRIELRTRQFHDADHRLEVLCDLPAVISMAATDEEFGRGLVQLLLAGIPHAAAAAVAQYDLERDPDAAAPAKLFWDDRGEAAPRFRPSRRLIKASLETGETKLHVWAGVDDEDPHFTVSAQLDWALCTPIQDPACRGWCLYVSGRMGRAIRTEEDLTGDIRFTELLAQTTGAIRKVQSLEQQQAGLRQFFSPTVMEAIAGPESAALLQPTERDITVLFCDIRGFSRATEESADNLEGLLARTSEALGLMTRAIIRHEGAVADFQGDAALAFWGWPLPPDDGPLAACRAALAIQQELEAARDDADHPLAGFRVGIGIAHGRAIAGKIGAPEQAKVGVLGPVVNLGARLEAMTKQLGVSVLIDEATAHAVRAGLAPSEGRARRMGKIRPYGLNAPLMVSHLIPPESHQPRIDAAGIADFEAAVDAVAAGEWGRALELLENVPGPDRAKDFLTVFIAQNNYEPPPNWQGVIALPRK
ncbi:MAG: adenylate/guanylate cyclase domain-containing protein [Planctomycetales bacterium]|nr:adenylate/guanylate cyclase domain-containing protein [Planctomycetales bacterium]